MPHFTALLRRFGRDERGVFAVLFGLMAIVLVALGGAGVDYVALQQARNRAQVALDAAVLALQSELNVPGVTDESILLRAQAIVIERIGDSQIDAVVDQVDANREMGRLRLSGAFTMPTIFVRLVGVNELSATFTSEAVRGSVDMEVSIALDITLSMQGQRIVDLKASVGELVDAIVQDTQEPTYSKVALVPYSQAVNAGTYATALRGPIRGPKNISGISWAENTIRNISGATRSGTITITSNGHGYQNNDWVYIWGVTGMTQLNGRAFQVTNRQTNTFQLRGVNSSNYSNYSRNGQIRKCNFAECQLQITSNGHGYNVGEWLHVTGVGGLTGVNNVTYQVASRNANTLMLAGLPTSGAGNYTNNTGQLHCTWQSATEGCSYYRFENASRAMRTLAASNCVTERAFPYDDRPPTTTLVGRNYPPGSDCPNSAIVPLTSNKTTLHNTINTLPVTGTTAGSLGILWAWYMLSPNFGYVWPFDSRPADYDAEHLLKAAIIMTDGEFNTVHCEGVVSRDSGIVSSSDRNRCDSPNGEPYEQSRLYCDAMKATGIVVYTVGFGIAQGTEASNIMRDCASRPENAYLAANGSQLRTAFQQIARNISALRLTL